MFNYFFTSSMMFAFFYELGDFCMHIPFCGKGKKICYYFIHFLGFLHLCHLFVLAAFVCIKREILLMVLKEFDEKQSFH